MEQEVCVVWRAADHLSEWLGNKTRSTYHCQPPHRMSRCMFGLRSDRMSPRQFHWISDKLLHPGKESLQATVSWEGNKGNKANIHVYMKQIWHIMAHWWITIYYFNSTLLLYLRLTMSYAWKTVVYFAEKMVLSSTIKLLPVQTQVHLTWKGQILLNEVIGMVVWWTKQSLWSCWNDTHGVRHALLCRHIPEKHPFVMCMLTTGVLASATLYVWSIK